jgi:hypothetical protein
VGVTIEKTDRRMWYADVWRVRASGLRDPWRHSFLLQNAELHEAEIALIERSLAATTESRLLLEKVEQVMRQGPKRGELVEAAAEAAGDSLAVVDRSACAPSGGIGGCRADSRLLDSQSAII